MFNSNEYFVKNAEDEKYNNFLTKVNVLNKVINQIAECDKLVELDEKIEEANKEFAKLEKNLKKYRKNIKNRFFKFLRIF